MAERIGVSGQRLRQLARSYERVRGELPRDERGRVWPEKAVEELERARELVRIGRATGIEQALRGELTAEVTGMQPATREPMAGDIVELAGELRALRQAVEEQNRIMQAVAERLEDLERVGREKREPASGEPDPAASGGPHGETEGAPKPGPAAGREKSPAEGPRAPARGWPQPGLWRRVRRLLGLRI